MLHMIGNAHLDPVWLWRWQEGCAEAIGTCWAAIDRLQEEESFVFTRGEAQVYAWIEEFDPALFERIRHYVAEGRWVVVNGWWIQPDCNLPSGEAIIRQALYGKRYFADRFGIEVPVGFNVDSFGHAATLPMLLRHTGSDSYVFMRPGTHEMTLPADLFDWIAPDGSTVPAFRIRLGYNTSPRSTPLDDKIDQHFAMAKAAGHPFMVFYGVGNHGGGPTRASMATIKARRGDGEDLDFSDPQRFFQSVAGMPRPAVRTELQFHAIGCYAAAGQLKAMNRRAEARLDQAETASTLAWREAGTPYPHATLDALWRTLLFNQFHDTLGGTSLESACRDAEHDFAAVLSGADAVINAGARHLARTIQPSPADGSASLLLLNFNHAAFDGLYEAEPWTDFDATTPRLLLDEDDRPVPFQYVSPEGKTKGMQRLAFRIAIPGYGRRSLRFASHPQGRPAPDLSFGHPVANGILAFESAGWRIVLDGDTGGFQLVNRLSGADVFTGPAHRGVVVEDPTDTWSHGIDRFGFAGEPFRLEALNLLEDGPLRTSIQIVARAGQSRLATVVVLPADADLAVELRVSLDWREQHRLCRVAYPLAGSRFQYEVPAGWTERPDDGREVFGHRWVRAERPGLTVAIVNDAKYSYAAQDGTLFITATRSPVYAHHDPVALETGAMYRYLDQGEQSFTILIQASAELTPSEAHRLADTLLKPPVATPQVARGGASAKRGSWLDVALATSVVTALKQSEDGQATIIRVVELAGQPDRLRVQASELDILARGIVTARLDDGGLRGSDGLER